MTNAVFIDTDVILDVALAREPFLEASKIVLAMAETTIISAKISSNCVANLYYILQKIGGDKKAREFIENILKYVQVIPIHHQAVLDALTSGFTDFEDALQHFSALENQCSYIITRNSKDYKESKISVKLPEEFLLLHSGKF